MACIKKSYIFRLTYDKLIDYMRQKKLLTVFYYIFSIYTWK